MISITDVFIGRSLVNDQSISQLPFVVFLNMLPY